MSVKNCNAYLFSSLIFATSVSYAIENTALDEEYFFGEMPIVLSASRLAQPLADAPASMTVINRELIETSGAITIPDVLRLVPGFQVSQLSGQNMTVQYHGLASQNPKRMQVLIDGRSVYHSAFGGVHWDALPISLNDIDRIEVLRGSNASTYGSNAFLGVINIITRHPAKDRGTQISLLGGYSQTYKVELRHAGQQGQLDYRIGLSALTSGGFPDYIDKHDYWDSTGVVPADQVASFTPWVGRIGDYELSREDDQQIGRLNLRGDYLMDNGDILMFQAGYVRNDREDNLTEGDYDTLHPNDKLRSNFQFVKWTRQLLDQGELYLQFSHNQLDFDGRHTSDLIVTSANQLINFGPVLGGYQYTNDRYDLELQHTTPEQAGWRIAWGMGARLDQISAQNLLIDNQDLDRRQFRVFANTDKHFGENDQWLFNAGVMLEYQQGEKIFASPRIALNKHLDRHNTLRFAVSRAYRMPAFADEFNEHALFSRAIPPDLQGVGVQPFHYITYSNRGASLQPEELTSYEIGVISTDALFDNLSFDVRLFHEQLRHYIDDVDNYDRCVGCDSAPASLGLGIHDLWVQENAGWLDTQGIEVQTRFTPNDRTTFLHNVSFTGTRGVQRRVRDANGDFIPTSYRSMEHYVPKVTSSLLLAHRFGNGWTGSLGHYLMSDMRWSREGDWLSDYQRFDLRLAKSFELQGNDTELELIMQNALDDGYNEFREQNVFERRLYVRLKMDIE